ncbi:MAG: heavy metal-associated domain-containing protein [Aequorivita antarctica]
MKHTYKIHGMTCGGCKASVEKYLGQLDNVTKVVANVEKGEAEVTMNSHISAQTLQNVLPEKYLLSEKETKNIFHSAYSTSHKMEEKSKIQQ